MAEFTGSYPQNLLLIGCQPVELEDFGGSLRDEVKAQIDPSLAIALDYLRQFGVEPEPACQPGPALAPGELGLGEYEAGRPSEEEAFRKGDIRFINTPPASGDES